ncbi:prolipoprotein diacylglyceryl transferase, partial [Erythrobacter litoralis]|uniref:prolipoprotein diacylglyceryl transferase family protein n=1 Tax=Erythrobacter litoralis TaxID=39960 RepID=UPI002435439E
MLSLLVATASAADPIYWSELGLRPYLFSIGGFELRYYSLAYLVGILLAYWHLSKMIKAPGSPMAQRHADDLFFYCTLGVIIGGGGGGGGGVWGGGGGHP